MTSSPTANGGGSSTGTTFEDGVRAVDMILAFETFAEDDEDTRHKAVSRQFFMDGLVKKGLELEEAKNVSNISKLPILKFCMMVEFRGF